MQQENGGRTTDRTSSGDLIHALAVGLHNAKGDRLVDVLGIVAYNIIAFEQEPAAVVQAAQELLPGLVDIAADRHTHAMLRGTVAAVLAAFVPALERAAAVLARSGHIDRATVRELRTAVFAGYRECLAQPTSIAGRKALADAVRYLKPVSQARALAQQMLADPAPAVAAGAVASLAIIERRQTVHRG